MEITVAGYRLRIEEKAPWERRRIVAWALIGLLLGFALVLAMGSLSPIGFNGVLRAFASSLSLDAVDVILLFAAPIVSSAAGLSIAYRAGFYTIGSEGQVIIGAVAAMYIALYSPIRLEPPWGIIVALAFSSLTGAAYSLIVGLLRIYAYANEVLTSLMLNYVAMYIVNYLVSGPWSTGMFTKTRSIPEDYNLPYYTVTAITASLAVLLEFILRRTRLGVAIEAYGKAPKAARTYGISPRMVLLSVSIVSGLAAGLGGGLLMLGFQHTLYSLEQPPGYGYMGVLVAWLSASSPLASLLGGVFFGYLLSTGSFLQLYGAPFNFVLSVQAVMVLSVIALLALSRYNLRLERREG
ncbi:MAG: ABC transporter permease [Pyrodictiaceae archaeon]